MIRTPYSPRVGYDLVLPRELADGVYVGAFDLRAMAEIGIWMRLIQDAVPVLLIGVNPRTSDGAFPASSEIQTVTDPDSHWRELIKPDRPERSFAMVVRNRIAAILMVGVPTEEGWDTFAAYL